MVVAHDYLTQRGGAERVALRLAEVLHAELVQTSVFVPEQTFSGFGEFPVQQSRMRVLQALRTDPRRALPFLARAWDRLPVIDADVVVCSSSGWAHAARTAPGTRKIVYCHNPARWLYQTDEYLADASGQVKAALRVLSPRLRRWDQAAAATADTYIANSTTVAARIREAYGIEAEVVHPPMCLDVDGVQEPLTGLGDGFHLSVSRPRGYKATSALIEAFDGMPEQRLVLVGVPPSASLPANVIAVGAVSEAQLRWLYSNARALTSVSHEDFGLTPIEANAFGTPCLVLQAGGFLDSVDPGLSGLFVPDQSVAAIRKGVREFPDDWDTSAIRAHAGKFSSGIFAARMAEIIKRV